MGKLPREESNQELREPQEESEEKEDSAGSELEVERVSHKQKTKTKRQQWRLNRTENIM